MFTLKTKHYVLKRITNGESTQVVTASQVLKPLAHKKKKKISYSALCEVIGHTSVSTGHKICVKIEAAKTFHVQIKPGSYTSHNANYLQLSFDPPCSCRWRYDIIRVSLLCLHPSGDLSGSVQIVNISSQTSGLYRCSAANVLGTENCYVNLSIYSGECCLWSRTILSACFAAAT